MEFIGFAVFGGVFLVLAFIVFTGLIWAAFSDGREAQLRRPVSRPVNA